MFSAHVSMFQGSLTTGPSLILAPHVDGTTKEPATTEKGLFAITGPKVSALGGTSWAGVVDEDRESSLGSSSSTTGILSPPWVGI